MDEKDLAKICLLISLIGVIIIYMADKEAEPLRVEGKEITKDLVGENVLLCGKIESLSASGKGTYFLKIDDGTKTDVVLFQSRATKQNIENMREDENACIIGTVAEYRGGLEIIAIKISTL